MEEKLDFTRFTNEKLYGKKEADRIKRSFQDYLRRKRLANIKKWMPSKRKRRAYYKQYNFNLQHYK